MEPKSFSRHAPRLGAVVLAMAGISSSLTLPTAKSIAAEMGVGWNLGNTMELINVQPTPTKALFDSVKAAGFKTVRIPAAWDMHANQTTHVIDAAWIAQVKTVVDHAIQDSLFVVLNIHWDNGWLEGKIDSAASYPNILATIKAKQGAYWKQIATAFKSYDRHLIFASANEPGVDNQANLGILLSIHKIFIDTVRATGGNNASRTLVLQGPSTSIEHSVDWVTTLPTDPIADRLMWEVHFYPYQFCLMGADANWGNANYYWGKGFHSTTDAAHNATAFEESNVDSEFNLAKAKFVDKNIPVLVGEFGAMKRLTLTGDNLKLHILSRRHFYNYVVKSAVGKGLIPIAWDAGGLGDGTMSVFRRSNDEGAIYDLGLLNAIRSGAGLAKLPGDTTGDYTLATGDNSLRILYSAKDSGRGQVSLPVVKANMSGYDSIAMRVYVKGSSRYDSAGVVGNGYVSLSLVTMSKNWNWRERTLGSLAMDAWKTYSIPVSSNQADSSVALVPADPTALQFLGIQAYSHGFRGAIYVDWIVFKNRNGTSDTIYNFNQTGPQEGNDNVQSVSLHPTSNVPTDPTWQTATTSKWLSAAILTPRIADNEVFRLFSTGRSIHATFMGDGSEPALAILTDLQGRTIWARSFETVSGINELEMPGHRAGAAILRIRIGKRELVGKIFSP